MILPSSAATNYFIDRQYFDIIMMASAAATATVVFVDVRFYEDKRRINTRAKYRLKFRDELAYGIQNMTINVFGKLNAGRDAHCLFVWKVPSVYGAQHAGRVAKVIDDCREMLPKKISAEVERQFNAMIDGIADLPAKARDALRNLLFVGDPNPDNSIADKYVDFVCNLVSEGGDIG